MKVIWKVYSLDKIFSEDSGIYHIATEDDRFVISEEEFETEEDAFTALLKLEEESKNYKFSVDFEIRKTYRLGE